MNILLLSIIYPIPSENKGTSVCHYFAKEWTRMGYNVRVIHVQAVYPVFFYWLAKLNAKAIASRTGAIVYTERDKGGKYEMDGVSVIRYPLFKMIPHGKFSKKAVQNMINNIKNTNIQDSYIPDVIIGHFLNPQLEVVSKLKGLYPDAVTALVIHGDLDQIHRIYGKSFYQFGMNIDSWGFRSVSLMRKYENIAGKQKNKFFCYSGIPEEMLLEKSSKQFNGPLHKFIYIGEMIERKYAISVVMSIVKIYPGNDFKLTYVGDGNQLGNIRSFVKEKNAQKNVVFTGTIPRSQIVNYLDDAECFIMISRGEAFGLVYIEAMARGCITIASRDEGIDGIIIDGQNGFLCKAGDVDELSQIILRINRLSAVERKQISENARATVSNLTDKKVAEQYINDVIKFRKQNYGCKNN